jgi:hypothetical protein
MAQDIQVYNIPNHLRGDTWVGIPEIIIRTNGQPLSLSGANILMQFRKDIDSSVALELSTDNNGIVITDALNGKLSIPEVLITMQYGTYKYDLQVTASSGFVKTYLMGTWKIVADVSHL